MENVSGIILRAKENQIEQSKMAVALKAIFFENNCFVDV